ncbi:hypothetical protein ACFYNF_36330, partial [Streptomyces sp. NPDC006641]|uniref:hypothetical protein n=1 Tax=unclassified Streptomyces TaxID=2593676 RepID=UPI0036846DC1
MAIDDTLQRGNELVDALPGIEPQHRRHDIHVAALLRIQQVVEEDPLLQWCERVDVGNVRRTTRNRLDDPVEIGWGQF